jgi:hypothetical protein
MFMKKRIIFAITTIFFAVVTIFNMEILQPNAAGDISLESISVMAQAQTEDGNGSCSGGRWQYVTASGIDYRCDGNALVVLYASGGFEYCTSTGAIKNDNTTWIESYRVNPHDHCS